MPFDAITNWSEPTVRKPPTLEDMPALLRDRTRWPAGFVWHYWSTRSCALGLARRLGASFYLDESLELQWIFLQGAGTTTVDVKPEFIADALEAYLSRRTAEATPLKTGPRLRAWHAFAGVGLAVSAVGIGLSVAGLIASLASLVLA